MTNQFFLEPDVDHKSQWTEPVVADAPLEQGENEEESGRRKLLKRIVDSEERKAAVQNQRKGEIGYMNLFDFVFDVARIYLLELQ